MVEERHTTNHAEKIGGKIVFMIIFSNNVQGTYAKRLYALILYLLFYETQNYCPLTVVGLENHCIKCFELLLLE